MKINVEQFYTKYGPMVLRRCRALLKNEEQALDAMQEVFVKVLQKSDVLDDRAPSSLLYTIATNICLNELRKNRGRFVNDGNEMLEMIAGMDNHEELVLTGHFLEQLFENEKETTKTMAVLHYVDGYTLEQTANMMEMSVSGVRKRLRGLRERGLAFKEE
ncbi:MAG: sigma-70 family RNA polymerase sigma factor [Spirochaetales bacterium]|uniref:Sigma-70 family RNA polymerase sigma factor n=1 Tax=Candidatus Thalassospirochaeta sargassi TaxID=3119039 RepID=A0AAJ1IJY7_9SPIO|nr:sigma-70 family RNA polymerase sigma factor [Spirochaetales bacterium]